MSPQTFTCFCVFRTQFEFLTWGPQSLSVPLWSVSLIFALTPEGLGVSTSCPSVAKLFFILRPQLSHHVHWESFQCSPQTGFGVLPICYRKPLHDAVYHSTSKAFLSHSSFWPWAPILFVSPGSKKVPGTWGKFTGCMRINEQSMPGSNWLVPEVLFFFPFKGWGMGRWPFQGFPNSMKHWSWMVLYLSLTVARGI
jgi:hypothetical protein